mmetsp:Transcript_17070/g.26399  ORF Transcript_17070/g.26399 Transcript_17070/m.26399 type:complete len:125 (+) Transcript_17070:84-458(+)
MKNPSNTIRFAMPYDVRCTNEKCPHPSIGAGVRFNARKASVDKYLESINIFEFRMKCPNCDNEFRVRTDPKSCDYQFVSGVKKLFSEYLSSKKAMKAELAQRTSARAEMSLGDKVKSMADSIKQ